MGGRTIQALAFGSACIWRRVSIWAFIYQKAVPYAYLIDQITYTGNEKFVWTLTFANIGLKLIKYEQFSPLEVVGRGSETQLQRVKI